MTVTSTSAALDEALHAIRRSARHRDQTGTGIASAFDELDMTGVIGGLAHPDSPRPPASWEFDLVRRVAHADGSLGRIIDGHLNAIDRLVAQAPRELAVTELERVSAGQLRTGVWGGKPRPEEGRPARLRARGGLEVLSGTVTFCSGAGLLDRALVLAQDADCDDASPPVAVWIDLTDLDSVHVDEAWYASSGLRASQSHRVTFDSAPVVARFGEPGAITAQPWFARDALRTAATWAGMADLAVESALRELSHRPSRGSLEDLAAGRILAHKGTIDVWLRHAASQVDDGAIAIPAMALHARVAISAAATGILSEAAAASGSHPFATGGDLDRARRDLQLFLLQHRLEPGLARAGASALSADHSAPLRS